MSKELQIYIDEAVEEMASAIRPIMVKCGKCEYYNDGDCRKPVNMDCDINEDIFIECDALYEAGYRKTFTSALASDTQKAFKEGYEKALREVAREIFEEIEKILAHNYMCYGKCYDEDIESEIDLLKKKYTEEEK